MEGNPEEKQNKRVRFSSFSARLLMPRRRLLRPSDGWKACTHVGRDPAPAAARVQVHGRTDAAAMRAEMKSRWPGRKGNLEVSFSSSCAGVASSTTYSVQLQGAKAKATSQDTKTFFFFFVQHSTTVVVICSSKEGKGEEFVELESECTLSLHLPLTIAVGKCSATRRTASLI